MFLGILQFTIYLAHPSHSYIGQCSYPSDGLVGVRLERWLTKDHLENSWQQQDHSFVHEATQAHMSPNYGPFF